MFRKLITSRRISIAGFSALKMGFYIVAVASAFGAQPAFSQEYVLLSLGKGGTENAFSFGLEYGNLKKSASIGVGFSVISVGYSKPLPFGIFVAEHSNEYELFGAVGMRIAPVLFFVTTIGLTGQSDSMRFVAGGADDPGYDPEYTINFAISGQLRLAIKSFMAGIGYHNRRGLVGMLGFVF